MKTHEKSTKMLVKPPSRTFSDPRSQWKAARLATMPTSIKHGLKMDAWWILGYSSPAFNWVWRKGVSKSAGQSSFFLKKKWPFGNPKKSKSTIFRSTDFGKPSHATSATFRSTGGELPVGAVAVMIRLVYLAKTRPRNIYPVKDRPSQWHVDSTKICWFSFMPFTSSINPTRPFHPLNHRSLMSTLDE